MLENYRIGCVVEKLYTFSVRKKIMYCWSFSFFRFCAFKLIRRGVIFVENDWLGLYERVFREGFCEVVLVERNLKEEKKLVLYRVRIRGSSKSKIFKGGIR